MKLQDATMEFHAAGVQSKHDFRVVTNAKMMNMLSNSLYSDKVKAVIRELSTNAYDAHVEAGNKEKPFEVYLPSRDNTEFCIRDYGTGLSKRQLEGLYRSYGASNKNDSNMYTGCMGIGSKSPFAYTDSFVVTSYYNGQKLTYVCGKDKRGIPSLILMEETSTEELNGLQVSFSVHLEDIEKFEYKAKDVYTWFPVKPDVYRDGCRLNKEKLQYNTVYDNEFKGKGWKLKVREVNNRKTYSYNLHPTVIMGNIEYPIEPDQFLDSNEEPVWWTKTDTKISYYQLLVKYPLELHFDIGEVEMDISREGLQYNDVTINAIKKRLDIVYQDMMDIISNKLENTKCIWDILCIYNGDEIISFYRNKKFFLDYIKSNYNDSFDSNTVLFRHNAIIKLHNIILNSVYKYVLFYKNSRNKNGVSKSLRDNNLYPRKSVRVYVADMKTGNHVACERMLNENDDIDTILLITPGSKETVNIKEVASVLHITEEQINKCSDIPKKKKDNGSKSRKKEPNSKTFVFNYNTHSNNSVDFWTPYNITKDDGGIYVEINRYRVVINKTRTLHPLPIKNMLKSSIKDIVGEPTIIGVKTANINKFKKSSKWTPLDKWLEMEIKKWINKNNLREKIKKIHSTQYISSYKKYCSLLAFIEQKGSLNDLKDSPLKEILKRIKEVVDIKNGNDIKKINLIYHISNYRTLYSHLGFIDSEIKKSDQKLVKELEDLEQQTENTYPMLRFVPTDIQFRRHDKDYQVLVNYLNS